VLQPTQKKKGENPFQKREENKERKERKGNHGCFSSHRTSGHHQMRKRSQDDNQKKTYECKDSVTVLGMVCEKRVDRVAVVRQPEEDRRIREETVTVVNLHADDSTGQETQEDDEGTVDEREI
jgi:hypothetical protein